MKFSIITANKNGERFLEESIESVLTQRTDDIEIEYIVIDGASTDRSTAIIDKFLPRLSYFRSEPDNGPADAINKGLSRATGEIVAWLNADDRYYPGALGRVAQIMRLHSDKALCFGPCNIIDENGDEIRRWITRFKAFFFPLSSRFTIQCLNYISQPALFFRRRALEAVGLLDNDMLAAWDYDLTLRLWRQGGAVCVKGAPLADFRWHAGSISGRGFATQFKEEFEAAKEDAGPWAPQTWIHYAVRWGIVGIYAFMADLAKRRD